METSLQFKIFGQKRKNNLYQISVVILLLMSVSGTFLWFGPFIKWLKLSLFAIIYEPVTFFKERKISNKAKGRKKRSEKGIGKER